MPTVKITINDVDIEAGAGASILEAARAAEIYIPSLCAHPNLPALVDYPTIDKIFQGDKQYNNDGSKVDEGCRLCLVDIGGQIQRSCSTTAAEGMKIKTETDEVVSLRKMNLSKILERHPHACLTCSQREGCQREPCSTNVPVDERCCIKFGNCEVQKVSEFIGIPDDTPRYKPKGEQRVEDEPIFVRDYNLCINCGRCTRACNELRGIKALGMVKNDKETFVGTTAPTLKDSECKFCGACVEVCPTGTLLDKTTAAQFDRANALAPCTAGCPANIDIPRYVRLIAEEKPEEALAVIREKVPFPRVLGRICMHPCEEKCRRGEVNEPVAICALKRYVSEKDRGLWKKAEDETRKSTDKKVAVIGSGPAGMTAAFYTAKAGHSVTVFESETTPGGMLTHTIPLYRLPKEILDEDMQDILEVGDIELRTGQTLGKDFTLDELQTGGFDATFIAVGLQQSRKLNIPGVEHENVIRGIDFLKEVRAGERVATGTNVLVIGGGNVAVDVARTVKRLGAEKVIMACLETREEMPANHWEISAAEEEDIEVMGSWGPGAIHIEENEVKGVEFKQCTSVFDSGGKFCPTYNDSNTTKVEADTIIMAIGQTADLSFIDENNKNVVTENNMLKVNLNNLKTDIKGVFAGGDAVKMPGTVIDAIQMGRVAAGQINSYLGGSADISEVLVKYEEPSQYLGRHEGFFDLNRSYLKCIEKENRITSFDEVELTYDPQTAVGEAKRCLQCDLRLKIGSNPMPPEPYLTCTEESIDTVPEKEGVIQVLDDNKEILAIKGSMNIKQELKALVESNESVKYFIYEEDPMYTQRESELLSQYMQKHGKMPGSDDDDDELF